MNTEPQANSHPNDELDRRLGRLELPEGRYRADIELHDRSLQFSAELVRLALAGIAVIGFLLANAPAERVSALFHDLILKLLLSLALLGLAGTAGYALIHRFYAGGAAFHHIQAVKLLFLDDPALETDLQKELNERTALFMKAHRFLKFASGLLILGAGVLGAAFVRFLFT